MIAAKRRGFGILRRVGRHPGALLLCLVLAIPLAGTVKYAFHVCYEMVVGRTPDKRRHDEKARMPARLEAYRPGVPGVLAPEDREVQFRRSSGAPVELSWGDSAEIALLHRVEERLTQLRRIPSPLPVSLSPVDSILAGLEQASIAFNTPPEMELREVHEMELLLSPKATEMELKRELQAQGPQESHRIKVSSRMEARLGGPGFAIEAIGPEVQAVSAGTETRWRWSVRAVEEGKQKLYLTLNAFIDVDGNTTPRKIETFARTINVHVSALRRFAGFVSNNWQWLWGALPAVVIWVVQKRKKKGGRRVTGT